MAKINKILIIFVLIVVTICFSACSSVRAMTITNEDGSIDELVYISLDEQALTNAGYENEDVENIQNDISVTAMREANTIIQEFKQRVNNQIAFTLDLQTRIALSEIKEGLEIVGSSWQDNTYVIGLRFKNSDVYKYYYNIASNAKVESANEEHFLYTKVSYSGLNMYVDYSELYSKLNAEFTSKYPEFIESNESELLYTYVTESRREHSDADYVTKLDGKYYHTWVVDSNNLDEPITLYYNIANRGNCILLCVGISVVLCLVLIIIGIFVDKYKKQKNIKIEK